ncbi:MAG: Transposase IS66 family protein [Spirochaetes bacterium ADurb.Bin110]|jgi:transposase|nr:MAG: Transposase IS66 family protein [Spirochaetes bacterium ADurb.Bin110]HNV36858.1 IS66 family transposase [Rectinema sp.]
METVLSELPDDVESLKKLVVEQARRAHELEATSKQLEDEIAALKLKLQEVKDQYQLLQQKFFGSSSEKRKKKEEDNPKQPLLFNEAETYAEAPATPEKKTLVRSHERKVRGRKPLPENLERREFVHALSEAERTCPSCGAVRPEIGQEVREELEFIPARFVVNAHIIKKYGPCQCEVCANPIVQAEGPAKIIPGSSFSNNTIAFFLTSKFVDAQPFYRMERILSRWGIETSRASLCKVAVSAGRAIGDLLDEMRKDLKASPVAQLDETIVQVLHEKNRSAQAKSYMWVARGYADKKPIIFFHYHPSRAKEIAHRFLEGYQGFVQTDGYSGYDEVGFFPGITHVGCLAHVRRKFFEAEKQGSKEASEFIELIAELYHAEKNLRQRYEEGALTAEEFLSARTKEQGPRLARMKAWLISKQGQSPPSLSFGKAVNYALGQWDRIEKYLGHELLTPDTNAVENAIRPFVIGRKNWLFSNTPLGAHASAGIYSLIETAKANGHEPYRYLCYLFNELPKAKRLEEKRALLPYRLAPGSY